ncbi:hypothetical protein TSUD_403200 [Trifolium subterraneum]|uniref:Transposase, Ptta/En/Spm, plant n=1 Tax=Trifolium subterraneum TaxID=3900 RepID=A0A2Z6PB26_TRISU|nr:hypothetical protein TSUD_403200 [Trifolium subterraneum]
MPTPGICLPTMAGSSQHASRGVTTQEDVQQTSHDEDGEGNEVDDEDEEGEVGQGNVPPLVHRRDANGKIIIHPLANALIPPKEVADAINYAIRKQFFTAIDKWSILDEDTYKKWFGFFAEKVSWDPRDHAAVERIFKKKGAKRLSDMLTKVRKKPDRPAWIGDDAWKELQEIWKSDEFKKISNQNKVNRDSKRGGAVHTSGRKSHVDVALELSNNLQKDLDPDELFLITHKIKSGVWVDTRSETTYAKYKKKLATIEAQIGETGGDGVQKVDGVTKLQLWTESVGGRTRGRVYGTGDLSANLGRGCTSLIQQSQNSHGSMYVSLEAQRAAREIQEAKAWADEAIAEAQEAKAIAQTQAKMSEERSQNSANGSCSPNHASNSHPDYDDDLDDQSLEGDT